MSLQCLLQALPMQRLLQSPTTRARLSVKTCFMLVLGQATLHCHVMPQADCHHWNLIQSSPRDCTSCYLAVPDSLILTVISTTAFCRNSKLLHVITIHACISLQESAWLLTSPAGSTAREANCTGWGAVMVRKLRYLTKSKARTVPSKLALMTTLPLGRNVTAVTGLVCSEKVTKQKPDCTFHTFTYTREGKADSGCSA